MSCFSPSRHRSPVATMRLNGPDLSREKSLRPNRCDGERSRVLNKVAAICFCAMRLNRRQQWSSGCWTIGDLILRKSDIASTREVTMKTMQLLEGLKFTEKDPNSEPL